MTMASASLRPDGAGPWTRSPTIFVCLILPGVSFSADARVVRDTTRTFAEREAALARCVATFRPFGLLGTFAHLDRHACASEPSERLVAAIEVLDDAHVAWPDELARFAQQRKAAKARGLRRVSRTEIERYA